MRDDIREISVELLIKHGYQGFRFRDVADHLKMTRANIHYYYGNKQKLCEEVVVDYVGGTLAAWEANWNSDKSFEQKIRGMMESNRQRYLRYNPTGQTGHPWSLIGRMRLERDLVGPKVRDALAAFGTGIHRLIVAAIDQAVARGELSADAPKDDIALQLAAIANSADPITQDTGSFDSLEQLYLSFGRVILHAYGTGASSRGASAP
jgi:TetR/AcrR family transcriptional regulator, transcriptional repressor for nem operon